MDLTNKNVIHIKKDGIEFLQFRKLLEYKDYINHAYSLGIDKNFRTARANKQELQKEEYEKAIEDYKNLSDAIGSEYTNLVKTNQEHTDCVKVVKEKINANIPDINTDEYEKTDGLITNQTRKLLSTTNADCILLLFFDPVKKVIGNTHSGWKGTLQRISAKTVKKMQEEFGCESKDIICCICPSIRKCHFEVEKDVKDLFEKEFQDLVELENLVEEKDSKDSKNLIKIDEVKSPISLGKIIEEKIPDKKWNIDTVLINQIILEKAGLRPENIIDSEICSVCNSNIIHSFRVEKEGYGLNTALIELK